MRAPRRIAVMLGLASGLALTLAWPVAAKADSLEYAVKAAYLTKFVPFITWPGAIAPAAPVSICVLGDDPFGGKLEQAAASAKAGEHVLVVRHVAAPDASCQIEFLALSDPAAADAALEALKGKPVVTVADSGVRGRGTINFVVVDNHVRFDIDDDAAAQGGLSISSKLLGLAHAVKQRGPP